MEYFCDTSMTSSPYPSQLSITSSELNDAATVNGVDALSVKGTQPGGDDLPQVNGHTDSNTIGNTCPTSTDLSWQDAGRASLSVTNVTTAGASYNSTIQKEPDAASIHSSNMANNGSNADSRSIASAAANASLHSDRAKLIAHLTSYAGEHVGDCGRGFCVVHDDGRPLPSTEPYIVNHPLATTPAASKKPDEQSATLSKQAHELQPNSANSTTDLANADIEPALGQTVFPIQNTSALHSSPHAIPTSAGSRFRLTVSRVVVLIILAFLDLLVVGLIIWQITLHGSHELKLAKRCILGGTLAIVAFTSCAMLTVGRNLLEILLMAVVVILIGMMLPWELDGLM